MGLGCGMKNGVGKGAGGRHEEWGGAAGGTSRTALSKTNLKLYQIHLVLRKKLQLLYSVLRLSHAVYLLLFKIKLSI